jgi:staphyloferrin B biosynthesis citrate synthase
MTTVPSTGFRQRLLSSKEPLFGTFIKTPSPHATEIIGALGFDFVIIDAEHAPLDRGTVDHILLAAKAAGIASLVRVPATTPHHILAPLDDGAAGVVAPHISSAAKARELVDSSRYARNRGFSNSPRAGGYGERSIWEHVDAADQEISVIAMIEDPEAVEDIEAILAVDGLDAIFIGRGDMSVAMNDRLSGAPGVRLATERVIEAARQAQVAVLLLASTPAEAAEFRQLGVTGFVLSSDQGFMRAAAAQALKAFSESCINT